MHVHTRNFLKPDFMSKTIFHPAENRGHANHGWLNAYHSFSFAGYHDPSKIHFGALRVLNDDTVKGGTGFGTHPHDNMEIITIILEGALEHKDSLGHTQQILPGEVQVMSAGTGVQHSEYNPSRTDAVNLLQSWIFPQQRNVAPRYDQRTFAAEERINQLQTLVSPIDNDDPGLKINQQAWIYRTHLLAGQTVTLPLHTDKHGVYLFMIDGSATAEGQSLNKRDAMGISDTGEVTITATADSDILLYEVPMHY
jgi:hypothetical protein